MSYQDRKDDHIRLFRAFYRKTSNDFDHVVFVHHALPEMGIQDVNLSTTIGPLQLPYPLYINAMTGGSEQTLHINKQLAIVARKTGLPIATGSMSIILTHPETEHTFRVIRQANPKGIIFANMGAGYGPNEAQRMIECVEADALQIHLNAPQELVMPEGDRDFSSWMHNIEKIVKTVTVPVIVKEVGFGMSRETIRRLASIGVTMIDVGGRGGTNFIQIENERRRNQDFAYLQDWGQSTVISLLEALQENNKVEYMASGGIRSMLDAVKALALGAKAVGIAGRYLYTLLKHGIDALIHLIQTDLEELRHLYTLLGARNWYDLQKTDIIFKQEVVGWCDARGIDYKRYANRSR